MLVKKLEYYGIRGISNKWFASYLSKGSSLFQLMVTNQIWLMSSSILEPLLFLIYKNDLHVAIKYSEVHHFADDANLLNFDSCVKSLNKQVNYDLKNLSN